MSEDLELGHHTVEIAMVRHATTAWSGRRYCGRSDPQLTAAGRAEAVALARRLAPTLDPDTRLVSSPARRAAATAAAIAAALGDIAIQLDPRWMETYFGDVEGLGFDELAARHPELAQAILDGETAIDWPGGETAAAFTARVTSAWHELAEAARPVVVVTHAGPILYAMRLARNGVAGLSDVPEPATEVRLAIGIQGADRRAVLPSPA
ncbi:MAG: histidine phosphatase family protein [Chloroflexota bacterium]